MQGWREAPAGTDTKAAAPRFLHGSGGGCLEESCELIVEAIRLGETPPGTGGVEITGGCQSQGQEPLASAVAQALACKSRACTKRQSR